MELELFYLFFARTADMCLATLRHLFAVRGRRGLASLAAFAEVMIYLFALRLMLSGETGALHMLVFAGGYAFGVFLGTVVDERLGLGTRLVQVVLGPGHDDLIAFLRRRLPVTIWNAEGRDGPKRVLHIHVRRRDHARLMRSIRMAAPGAFAFDVEPKGAIGGLLRFD